jgi:hypothetical protein
VAAFYTGLWLAGLWIFPLFPAQAKLGPVFTEVTHMVPLGFPVLIVPAAMAIDWALHRWARRGDLALSLLTGCGFFAAALLVQWPFASFLMTPSARNGIWGMTNFGYSDRPSDYHLAWEFHAYEKTRMEFWIGMGIALLVTIIACRVGLLWGDWMRRVRR